MLAARAPIHESPFFYSGSPTWKKTAPTFNRCCQGYMRAKISSLAGDPRTSVGAPRLPGGRSELSPDSHGLT